jgi:hypothetical protein
MTSAAINVRSTISRLKIGSPGGCGVTATLYLAKPEPATKRVYARVLDPGRTDVFVVSEADAGRLVKEPKDFYKQ